MKHTAPRTLTYMEAQTIRRRLIDRGIDPTRVQTTRTADLPALVKLAEIQLFPDIERVEDLAPNLSWHTPRLDGEEDQTPDERMATLYAIDTWRGEKKTAARHLDTYAFNGLGGGDFNGAA